MTQNTEQKNRDFSQVRIGTLIGFDRSWQMITAGRAYPVRFIESGVITFRDDDDCNHNIMENFFRANAYIIGQPDENYEPPLPVLKEFAETLLQNTEQNVRTREEQIAALTRRMRWDAKREAGAFIAEAEARGAAEQRRKDAEGQKPVAWVQPSALPSQDYPWYETELHIEQSKTYSLALYTRPANVAALEAEIASLKEAEQLARADAARFAWVVENTGCFWYGLPGFGPVSGRSCADRMKDLRSAIDKNMARAALTREGGV